MAISNSKALYTGATCTPTLFIPGPEDAPLLENIVTDLVGKLITISAPKPRFK